jgi:hypothetical protein
MHDAGGSLQLILSLAEGSRPLTAVSGREPSDMGTPLRLSRPISVLFAGIRNEHNR